MEMITIQQLKDQDYILTGVEIKETQTFAIKKTIIQNIIDLAITETDGVKRCDYPMMEFAIEYNLINQYTNIDFALETETIAIFDDLKQRGIVDEIIDGININDVNFIERNVDREIQQIMDEQNSVGLQVKKAMDEIIKKIPDGKEMQKMLKGLPNLINKIDKDKIATMKDIFDINRAANNK